MDHISYEANRHLRTVMMAKVSSPIIRAFAICMVCLVLKKRKPDVCHVVDYVIYTDKKEKKEERKKEKKKREVVSREVVSNSRFEGSGFERL